MVHIQKIINQKNSYKDKFNQFIFKMNDLSLKNLYIYIYMDNLVIIHIGKCGGSTVRTELKYNNIKFGFRHVEKVKYEPNNKYVIIIRNPIKRFISAFNWRYYLVTNKLRKKGWNNRNIETEEIFFNKYNNIKKFCNDLKDNPLILKDFDVINHMNIDIHFYLKEFIDKCPRKQIFGVICTETLKDDMKNIFDIDVIKHEKNNSKFNKIITDKNYKILKTYLKNDYIIIDKMYKYGWISDKQYKILKL